MPFVNHDPVQTATMQTIMEALLAKHSVSLDTLNKQYIYTFLIGTDSKDGQSSSIAISQNSKLYLISVFDRVEKTSAPKDPKIASINHITVKQTSVNEAIFRNRFASILSATLEYADAQPDIFALIVKSPLGQMYEIELNRGHSVRAVLNA